MSAILPRPGGAPADWPEFSTPELAGTDAPQAADDWPAPQLTWRHCTPHVLSPARGDVVDAWLIQPGAPGPVAVAYRHRCGRSHPYGWRCGVLVLVAGPDGRTRMAYDCTGFGIAKSAASAQDQALQHVAERHQDVAVPYAARLLRARRFYA
ncbi:hypothetical protein ACSHXN_43905 (plasmid) [Streptomyces sp. HUAS TT11]|uniref:hypothetical protein n=1 Tax=Streptomyces sp. HUAS TT11 TaxID=3447508 RepID=UPI003F656738